jgi:DNA-binding response OmpR family regulator
MNKSILVVEDTADLRKNIIELLCMEDYVVFAASHGKEAMAILKKKTPALIITDLLMPEMNGFDLIVQVRKNIKLQHVPILVFTAMPPHENEQKVLKMGANSYLKKPSTLENLLEAVKKLTEHE